MKCNKFKNILLLMKKLKIDHSATVFISVKILVQFSLFKQNQLFKSFQSFGVDIWMSQKWKDYRLKHNIAEAITPLLGLGQPSNLVWVPDTVFLNEINSKQHLVTVRNNKLDIHSDGTVHLISRVTVEASCRMNFRFYPFDTQFCYLFLESCKEILFFLFIMDILNFLGKSIHSILDYFQDKIKIHPSFIFKTFKTKKSKQVILPFSSIFCLRLEENK